MKTWLLVGLAVVLGVGAGIGTAWVRVGRYPWDGTPGGLGSGAGCTAPGRVGSPQPKVVINEDTHDFGDLDRNAKGRHEFILTNAGSAPLALHQGQTSCSCTVAILENHDIAPGESGRVVVEWTGKDYVGQFTQTATVMTNDPTRREVKLTIKGRITKAVLVAPSDLILNGITAGEEASAEVRLFGFRRETLTITGHEFSSLRTSENFEVTYKPLPTDQLAEEKGATSGCLVEVTVKPGLPVGAFRQKILLKTNYQEAPTIEVPVRGTIASEISIVGKGWNETSGILVMGTVRSQDGAERNLMIRAAGPHCMEVTFKPIEISPNLLKVKLGKTSHLKNGNIALTPLIVQIPKGSRPADHLGPEEGELGRIVLQTNHPKARELRILVRFAVEG